MMDITKFEDLNDLVIQIRGARILFNADVAVIYGIEARDINKAVTNNPDKFPAGYIIELSKAEKIELVENLYRFDKFKHSAVIPKLLPKKACICLPQYSKAHKQPTRPFWIKSGKEIT